ncbi:hypothetical protein BDW66DRAFT_157731 [Aspergillus desertorum]
MPTHTVYRLPQRTSINSLTPSARDLQVATDRYSMPVRDNVIPCSDGAGDIVEVGDGVREVRTGDRVGQQGGSIDGVLAQYVVRPASCGVKVSETARQSYSELASLVCTGVTAWNGLFGNVQLKPGQAVLVQGTGGISLTALVLAKAAGATTIITSSSNDKLRKVQEKSQPDYTINYKEYPEWGSRARELIGGQGVDHILEIGGIGTIEQSIEALDLALRKAAVIRGILIGPKCMLEELVMFADRRKLKLPVEKEFGFEREEVLKAYQELETGALGKVCIRVD